jgi:hypothetical protein
MRIARSTLQGLLCITICSGMSAAFGESTSSHSLSKIKTEGELTYYQGAIVVSGVFKLNTQDEFQSGVCFVPKGTTAKLIPRENDKRMAWFCFSNNEVALQLLNINEKQSHGMCKFEGAATIQISDYIVDKTESEVSDLAKLVKVISSEKPRTKKCEPGLSDLKAL